MEKKATARTLYNRISPKKARLIANMIRGLSVKEALFYLVQSNQKAGRLMKKTLNSAIANAETQHELDKDQLMVSEVIVNQGPHYKRAKPRNKGGRHPILKRTSHFTVVVEPKEEAAR